MDHWGCPKLKVGQNTKYNQIMMGFVTKKMQQKGIGGDKEVMRGEYQG